MIYSQECGLNAAFLGFYVIKQYENCRTRFRVEFAGLWTGLLLIIDNNPENAATWQKQA